MRNLDYDRKPDTIRLEQQAMESIRGIRLIAEEAGVRIPYFGYAISAIDTAVRVMEYEMYRKGVARDVTEPLPFEPEETDD